LETAQTKIDFRPISDANLLEFTLITFLPWLEPPLGEGCVGVAIRYDILN